MIYQKIIVAITLIFSSQLASADWGMAVGSGSYMGKTNMSAVYVAKNKKHMTTMGVGKTAGILGDDVHQINVKYLYSPFVYTYVKAQWNIISIGALATRCLCDETFVQNSSKYPEANYYDNTAYRFGIVFESHVTLDNWSLYWDWTLLDQLAIVVANNDRYANRPDYYFASGMGVRYFF